MKKTAGLMLLLLLLLAGLALLTAACGGGGGSGGGGGAYLLAGVWRIVSDHGVPLPPETNIIFTFNADGTGKAAAMGKVKEFTWYIDRNRLALVSGGKPEFLSITWLTPSLVQWADDGDLLILVRL